MTGFLFDKLADLDGCSAWEIVGKGRRAREVAKPGLRFAGVGRAVVPCAGVEELAKGEETRGRDMVMVAIVVF